MASSDFTVAGLVEQGTGEYGEVDLEWARVHTSHEQNPSRIQMIQEAMLDATYFEEFRRCYFAGAYGSRAYHVWTGFSRQSHESFWLAAKLYC
jgi:hypothetical protein